MTFSRNNWIRVALSTILVGLLAGPPVALGEDLPSTVLPLEGLEGPTRAFFNQYDIAKAIPYSSIGDPDKAIYYHAAEIDILGENEELLMELSHLWNELIEHFCVEIQK